MSWDIFAQDMPAEAKTLDDIPADFKAGPIGNRSDFIAAILEIVPFADFADPAWGKIDGEGIEIEVNIGDDEAVECIAFHVSGDERAAAVVSDILKRLDLRAFDTGSGGFFDHADASAGMERWREYRNSIVGTLLPEQLFYQGETAWFRQVDLKDLGDLTFLVPIASDLEMLGFDLLGDFICSALVSSIRAWVNRGDNTYVLILVGNAKRDGNLGVKGIFFEAIFSDGMTLTTSATPNLKDRQTPNSYRRVRPWSNAYNLYQEHKGFIEELSVKHGPTVPSGQSLLSIVTEMDKATVIQNQQKSVS